MKPTRPVTATLRALLVILYLALSAPVFAAGSNMPWESKLQSILDSVSGPVAKVLGAISIIVTGLAMTFGEGGSGMKKFLWVVFGLSIAFTSTSFFLTFFGFSGGIGM